MADGRECDAKMAVSERDAEQMRSNGMGMMGGMAGGSHGMEMVRAAPFSPFFSLKAQGRFE